MFFSLSRFTLGVLTGEDRLPETILPFLTVHNIEIGVSLEVVGTEEIPHLGLSLLLLRPVYADLDERVGFQHGPTAGEDHQRGEVVVLEVVLAHEAGRVEDEEHAEPALHLRRVLQFFRPTSSPHEGVPDDVGLRFAFHKNAGEVRARDGVALDGRHGGLPDVHADVALLDVVITHLHAGRSLPQRNPGLMPERGVYLERGQGPLGEDVSQADFRAPFGAVYDEIPRALQVGVVTGDAVPRPVNVVPRYIGVGSGGDGDGLRARCLGYGVGQTTGCMSNSC